LELDRRHQLALTDEGQRVFSRHGSPPVPLVPLILDHNLRNTRQIANAFQPLVDHPMRFLGGEGSLLYRDTPCSGVMLGPVISTG
jgi:hypothetical protein